MTFWGHWEVARKGPPYYSSLLDGLDWVDRVEEGNPKPACIPASPHGPVVFAWEGVDLCALNKPAVSSLCLQSFLCKAPAPSLLPAKKTRHGCLATRFTQLRPVQATAQGRVTARHGARCGQRLAGRHSPCSPALGSEGCRDPCATASQTAPGMKVSMQWGGEGCLWGAKWGTVCPHLPLRHTSIPALPRPPAPALALHAALLTSLTPGSS